MLAAPIFAWFAVFVIAPTMILFVYSFCQRDEMGELVFISASKLRARLRFDLSLHFLALYLVHRVDTVLAS